MNINAVLGYICVIKLICPYISVYSGTRVPSGAGIPASNTYIYFILALFHIIGDIKHKLRISILPLSGFLSVYVHDAVHIDAVKYKKCLFIRLRNFKLVAVPSGVGAVQIMRILNHPVMRNQDIRKLLRILYCSLVSGAIFRLPKLPAIVKESLHTLVSFLTQKRYYLII